MLFYCHYATPTLLRVEKKKEKKEVKMMDCTQLDSKSARRSLHDGNDVMIKQRLFFLQKKNDVDVVVAIRLGLASARRATRDLLLPHKS